MDLSDIKIERLKKEDLLTSFLIIKETILDNIKNEEIDLQVELILKNQKNRLKTILENPETGEFICAKNKNKIIGVIGFTKVGEETDQRLKNLMAQPEKTAEIIAAFIKPNFQSKGVGSLLFESIIKLLKEKAVEYFFLRTAYKKGTNFWTKKLGKETIIIEKYWNNRVNAYIWIKKL